MATRDLVNPDMQISVAPFEALTAFREPIESCGFVWRANDDDLARRYFRERPGRGWEPGPSDA
jgi:hypothetical protein